MISFFNEILKNNNLKEHDGRPLWKYNLSENEFYNLKKHLSTLTKYSYNDNRDITLYFAEWWKNEYNGGVPSIKSVYENIKNCKITEDHFYELARKGAISLGIKWIKRENRLYFRTLLLQGGLPIHHLLNPDNFNSYTRFLKKILELRPSSIDEFAYENDITSILPNSSRNDEIYECCLQIVEAVWNGNEEYSAIFNSRGGSNIYNVLKKHKETIENKITRNTQYKAYWILDKKADKNTIRLTFNFPNVTDADDLSKILEVRNEELKSEYNLVVNEKLLCRFRKNTQGNYKVFWKNNNSIEWDGKEMKPDIYLSSFEGNKQQFLIRLVDYPNLNIPTLWVNRSENEWILQKGNHCSQDEGFLLFPDNWKVQNGESNTKCRIGEKELNWFKFCGEIKLFSNENEHVTFRTKKTSFDWFLQESKPLYIISANMPIASHLPRIFIYDLKGEQVKKKEILWRLKGDIVWNNWGRSLPVGCIEYKINALDTEEIDIFYNIGDLVLDFESNNPFEARIKIEQSEDLIIKIKENYEEYDVREFNQTISIKLNDISKLPKTIKARITKNSINRDLHIEMVPPFHGVSVLDQEGKKLQDEFSLLFGHLAGYRIYTPINYHNYYIKLFNTNRPHIKIRKKIPNGITPLREYEEVASQLFRLTDAMDKETSVTMELIDENDTPLNKYYLKNYNCTLHYYFDDENLIIEFLENNTEYLKPIAIPLDCKLDEITPKDLVVNGEKYTINEENLKKFIVVSEYDKENNNVLLPAFVSSDKNNIPSTKIDRQERIKGNKIELESQNYNEPAWQKVKKYYDICIEYDLPFSTFDHLRASCYTPELSVKMFCFLSMNNDENFIDSTCQIIEDDLGFSFHWIPKKYWSAAIEWLENGLKHIYEQNDIQIIIQRVMLKIQELIGSTIPIEWFSKINEFITAERLIEINGFHLNTEIHKLRQRLGYRVLEELPKQNPHISEEFKHIIPITNENYIVKIILKAPLAVALSIAGKDESLWSHNEYSDEIRRNIKYVQWISPDWYGKAILYSLSRINN